MGTREAQAFGYRTETQSIPHLSSGIGAATLTKCCWHLLTVVRLEFIQLHLASQKQPYKKTVFTIWEASAQQLIAQHSFSNTSFLHPLSLGWSTHSLFILKSHQDANKYSEGIKDLCLPLYDSLQQGLTMLK